MDREMFWSMIEDARAQSAGDIERQRTLLTAALVSLPEEEIREFQRILWEIMGETYRTDLWDAASLIACGCSDDSFYDVRAWLIEQGRTVFETVLQDPENLVDLIERKDRFEVFDGRLQSVGYDAYEQKMNRDMPPEEGEGKPWILIGTFIPEEEYPAKFPRLWAKFGECTDEEIDNYIDSHLGSASGSLT